VTGSLEDLQADAAHRKDIAVSHWYELVFGARLGAEVNSGAGSIAQLEMASQEVGVEVREKDTANLQTEFRRSVDVEIDVTLWIDDDGSSAAGIADQVRRVSQTPKIELLEDHDPKILRDISGFKDGRNVEGGTLSSPTLIWQPASY